jgi:hypothetical protein
MSAKLVPTLADRGRRVVSATDPHGRILGFLDRSRYYFLQVPPQLYSRGRVDPVSNPLLLRKSVVPSLLREQAPKRMVLEVKEVCKILIFFTSSFCNHGQSGVILKLLSASQMSKSSLLKQSGRIFSSPAL